MCLARIVGASKRPASVANAFLKSDERQQINKNTMQQS
jgi:hypothetical protein